jgi:hypothetical protein
MALRRGTFSAKSSAGRRTCYVPHGAHYHKHDQHQAAYPNSPELTGLHCSHPGLSSASTAPNRAHGQTKRATASYCRRLSIAIRADFPRFTHPRPILTLFASWKGAIKLEVMSRVANEIEPIREKPSENRSMMGPRNVTNRPKPTMVANLETSLNGSSA